jgi:hypothetical protein
MEHNEMDDLFRKIINEDNTELNDQERISKVDIWNELEMPSRKRNFHFWKIAAVILLLLWGGTGWFFSKKINHKKLAYTQLQNNYEEVKNKLSSLELTDNNEATANKIEKENSIESDEITETTIAPIIQKEFIEKIVLVHDTIFINQNISPKQVVQIVKDTVFIEIPVKAPFKMTGLKNKKEQTPNKQPTPKTPSKIEFVFGKKPLKKPTRQNKLIIINENEVAKKTKKTNSSLIKIPIKN